MDHGGAYIGAKYYTQVSIKECPPNILHQGELFLKHALVQILNLPGRHGVEVLDNQGNRENTAVSGDEEINLVARNVGNGNIDGMRRQAEHRPAVDRDNLITQLQMRSGGGCAGKDSHDMRKRTGANFKVQPHNAMALRFIDLLAYLGMKGFSLYREYPHQTYHQKYQTSVHGL